MKKIKKILAVTLTLIFVISLIGCAGENPSENKGEAATDGSANTQLKDIRIGIPAADATGIIENAGIAEKLGYMNEELEKVRYKAQYVGFGQGGTAINEAIASKQIDIAFEGDVPPIIGVSNNLNIRFFASLNSEAEMGIIVGNNTNIQSVQDLKGKKVVAAFGTVTYVYLIKLLEANGMSIDDVEVINDIANGGTLVAAGEADAVISTGTGIHQFENAGVGTILTSSNEDTELSAQFFAVGDGEFLSENEEAAKAVVRALIQAQDDITAEPESTYKKLESDDYPEELWAQIYPIAQGFDKFEPYLEDSTIDKFNKTCEILKNSGTIKTDVTAEEVYDNTYTTAVYEELGLEIPN